MTIPPVEAPEHVEDVEGVQTAGDEAPVAADASAEMEAPPVRPEEDLVAPPREPVAREEVSLEPGAMPGEPVDVVGEKPTLPTPPTPAPPPIRPPVPSITPAPPRRRLQVEGPGGIRYTPQYVMGIGHVPAPLPEPLLRGLEAHLLAGLLAMGVGFILTGVVGLLGLWWAMGDRLFEALAKAAG